LILPFNQLTRSAQRSIFDHLTLDSVLEFLRMLLVSQPQLVERTFGGYLIGED